VALGRGVTAVDIRVSSSWDGGEALVVDVTVRDGRKGVAEACGGIASTGWPS
jgi:hypothetical protein